MASQPIDCTASAFRAATCTECGTHVVAAVDFAGDPMCLECRRAAEGIDWESQDPHGEWHPAVGYPRPIEWLDPPEDHPSSSGMEWRWGCVNCGDSGKAESAVHAEAMERMHDGTNCPAAAHMRSAVARRDRKKTKPMPCRPNVAAREYAPKATNDLHVADHTPRCRCGENHPIRCTCTWDSAENCPVPHGTWLSQKDRDGVARR